MRFAKPTIEDLEKCRESLRQSYHQEVANDEGRQALLFGAPGVEHYPLLCWFGLNVRGHTIGDVGTYWGASSLSLSCGRWNQILTYDRWRHEAMQDLPGNVMFQEAKSHPKHGFSYPMIGECQIIFLDISHNGRDEASFVRQLTRMGWKGLVIVDDILLNDEMKHFWSELKCSEKQNWTDIGHSYGTGLAYFD